MSENNNEVKIQVNSDDKKEETSNEKYLGVRFSEENIQPLMKRLKTKYVGVGENKEVSDASSDRYEYLFEKMDYLKKQVKIYEDSCYHYKSLNLWLTLIGSVLGILLSPSAVLAEGKNRYIVAFLIILSTLLLACNYIFKYGEKYVQFFHMSKKYQELYNDVEHHIVSGMSTDCHEFLNNFKIALNELIYKSGDLLPPSKIADRYN